MVKAIVGANWGDEGKGKITDMLALASNTCSETTNMPYWGAMASVLWLEKVN